TRVRQGDVAPDCHARGARGEQDVAPDGAERLRVVVVCSVLLPCLRTSLRLRCSAPVRRPGSHRRGHWFDPSIAHRLFPQHDSPLPGSWVTGYSLVARYMGSKWGAEPDLGP